jgi:4-amino-4-deoxy-L-arabinose transferase-like glycosyltransferase
MSLTFAFAGVSRRSLRRVVTDPARPALACLLVATSALYVWGLGASGWANSFYSAAVQAGAHSWKAFFFGSSDAANFITVDKTPMSLWPMELTARVFGVDSWSILVPQALMGVATVAVLYATVRRTLTPLGPRAAVFGGLLAGAALATTPVAALMFRFNNPDALLVLLLTTGAYALLRARESASTGWLLVAAVCVGSGFLTKMLQAFLVVPAFALVYAATAPAGMRRRLWQLTLAFVAMIASAGWWVAIVAAVPAGSRPYIGGSQHNSVLDLALGYNGLGRLNGNETGGLGNTNQDAGWLRMFGPELGGQIAWLLPAAFVLLIAGLWLTIRQARGRGPATGLWTSGIRRRQAVIPEPTEASASQAEAAGSRETPRREPEVPPGATADGGSGTGRALAAFALWGGWLLVTDLVFSLMQGIFHGYYTVALAPSVAALVGMGATVLWLQRHRPAAAITLAGVVALTAWWAYRLLGRTPDFAPWLRVPVLIGGLIAATTLLATRWLSPRLLVAGATLATVACLAAPSAYAIDTAGTSHRGAIPTAGPSAGRGGFPGGMRGGPGGTRRRPARPPGAGTQQGGMPQPPGGGGGPSGPPGQNPGTTGTGSGTGNSGTAGNGTPGNGGPGGRGGRGPMGGGGPRALLDAATPSATLTALLKQHAGSYTWAAATAGSNSAAGYQLATGEPVMAIGGFNGTDPAPSLAQFEQYVRAGKIHYFVGGSMARGGNSAQQITSWVTQTFTARTVDGVTVYDLSRR